MATNFSVKVDECNKTLTARERIAIKDTGNAVKLDTAVDPGSPLVIAPDYYAILTVHNEASEDIDYTNYVVVDKDGQKYVTGSDSFFKAFIDIYKEMENEDEEYSIEIRKQESKNYKGKFFLTCSIV